MVKTLVVLCASISGGHVNSGVIYSLKDALHKYAYYNNPPPSLFGQFFITGCS